MNSEFAPMRPAPLHRKILVLAAVVFGPVLFAASPSGDVVGKLTVGYQGWFSCAGDGSPINRWFHWGSAPERGKISFELWPDVREFERIYPTKFAPLGDGRPAALYSSYDDQVVATHFRWMRENGIDCAALQRFGSELTDPAIKAQRDGMARKVRAAAEASGRKFYLMYDLSGWRDFSTAIKADWAEVIVEKLALTTSPAYARENGKPVVCVWGIGFPDRPGNAAEWLDVVKWFRARGCYVIGGVTIDWRKQTDLATVFDACDMISPWTVGAYRWPVEVAAHKKREAEDLVYLERRGIAYQPVLFPGFAWSNWNGGDRNAFPRRHGDFLWQQFTNLRELGIKTAYIAMFDEFDEGTAIAKAAENASMVPGDQYFLTLDADGVECSADFYLRLTGDGARMIKGLAPLEATHPTPHRAPSSSSSPHRSQ